jgi:hypothetical protein
VSVPLVGTFALAVVVAVQTSGQEQARLQLIFERQAEKPSPNPRRSSRLVICKCSGLSRIFMLALRKSRGMSFAPSSTASWRTIPAFRRWHGTAACQTPYRDAYEEAVRQEGYADFQITEQDPQGRMVRVRRAQSTWWFSH